MTVSSSTNSNRYSGNGSTTVFAYGFKIFADADLRVILKNNTTGVETLQTLTTHYTVSNAGNDSGGNVTFVTAPASGNTVIIRRQLAYTQSTNYVENDAFPAEAHEDALDRATMLTQQNDTDVGLALQFPEGDVGAGLTNTLPSAVDRASKYVSFDASGNVQATETVTGVTVSTVAFTPVLADASSGGNLATIGTTFGRYQKIGPVIHLTLGFSDIDTTGMASSNQVHIRDLPFAAKDLGIPSFNWVGSVIAGDAAIPSAGTSWVASVLDATSYARIQASVNNSPIPEFLLVSDINSGSTAYIYLSITYEAES